jgi:hypothetical protein
VLSICDRASLPKLASSFFRPKRRDWRMRAASHLPSTCRASNSRPYSSRVSQGASTCLMRRWCALRIRKGEGERSSGLRFQT